MTDYAPRPGRPRSDWTQYLHPDPMSTPYTEERPVPGQLPPALAQESARVQRGLGATPPMAPPPNALAQESRAVASELGSPSVIGARGLERDIMSPSGPVMLGEEEEDDIFNDPAMAQRGNSPRTPPSPEDLGARDAAAEFERRRKAAYDRMMRQLSGEGD